jgi:3'-5' exoribonuclease
MKKQFVKDLSVGNKVNDIFYIRSRRQFEKRDGGKFLILELADKTGAVQGKVWDYEEFLSESVPGNFAKVQGDVSEYNGETQITVINIQKVSDKEISVTDFIVSSRFNIEEMYKEFSSYFDLVKDADLKKLLNNFFSNPDFLRKFKSAPASTGVHHAYIGGLLEHTLFMLRLSRSVPDVYPEVDYSLLITGLILHDVGKIREYLYDKVIAHTDEGYLIGHIVVGYEIVKNEIDKIAGFPELKKEMLLHIILSHHGIREYGSPTTPKFAEAYLVHNLDNLDARMMMFRDTTEKNQDVKWSDYHQFLETKVFIKNRATD